MDLSDRSQSRQNPQDPLVLDTAGYVWTRAVNPILAAVMRDRDNRPDIWPQSLRSDYHSASCQQGAVHIWVLACARTTSGRQLVSMIRHFIATSAFALRATADKSLLARTAELD